MGTENSCTSVLLSKQKRYNSQKQSQASYWPNKPAYQIWWQ